MVEKEELKTAWLKKKDIERMEILKDHPRQPIHEVVSELLKIGTKAKSGSQ